MLEFIIAFPPPLSSHTRGNVAYGQFTKAALWYTFHLMISPSVGLLHVFLQEISIWSFMETFQSCIYSKVTLSSLFQFLKLFFLTPHNYLTFRHLLNIFSEAPPFWQTCITMSQNHRSWKGPQENESNSPAKAGALQ